MKFIVLLTCLAINRYWVGSHPLHTEEWFEKVKEKLLVNRLGEASLPYGQFMLVVVLPAIIVGLLLWAIQTWFWGLLWMVLSFLVLGYAIGISNLDEVVKNQILWLRKLKPEDHLQDAKSRHRRGMQTLVHDEFVSVYPILFWFLILGPAGALLYRLSMQYSQSRIESSAATVFVTSLIHTLDWIPIRITGLAFCVVGDFDRSMNRVVKAFSEWTLPTKTVLLEMAEIAITELEIESDDVVHFAVKADYQLKEVKTLLHRTLLFWIALIAVITLLGWN